MKNTSCIQFFDHKELTYAVKLDINGDSYVMDNAKWIYVKTFIRPNTTATRAKNVLKEYLLTKIKPNA